LGELVRGIHACRDASAGCILTKDIPDPALEVPGSYKDARPASIGAPPTLTGGAGSGLPN